MLKSDYFQFTEANLKEAEKIISKYPEGKERSAVMPLLYLAQNQNDGWISTEVMNYIAEFLGIPNMHVYEVANFYTMYNKKPVGEYHIQICRTISCWLNGAAQITEVFLRELNTKLGETTDDGLFTVTEVECLGACVGAPVVQINDDYLENVSALSIPKIITDLTNKK